MNLQQLRYVAATVEHRTMTAAAEALHVSQPAFSRAIRALERELGVVLFARTGRRVVPTPAGLAVAERARHVLGELEALRLAASGLPVTIATTPTTGADLLPGLLRAWRASGVKVTLVLHHFPSPLQVAAAVESGQATLGLVDLPVPGTLVATPIATREVVLLCPRASPLRSPASPMDWRGLPLIAPTASSYRRTQLNLLLDQLDLAPRIVCETDERATWPTLAAANIGHVFVSRPQARRADPTRTRFLPFTPPLRQTIALIHRPEPLGRVAATMVQIGYTHR